MKLGKPPVGKFETFEGRSCILVQWSPGNSTKYEAVVTLLPKDVAKVLGGEYLVSIRSFHTTENIYVSYAVTKIGMLHETLLDDKFGKHAGSEQDLMMWTCLLNWILYPGESVCHEYAQEVWDEARERWSVARPVR